MLTSAASAKARKPELEAQLARANALRDEKAPTGTQAMSYVSPLQHLSRGFNIVRGQDKARRANAGLSQARQQMADASTGAQMYGLETTAKNRAEDVDFRGQQEANKTSLAQAKAAALAAHQNRTYEQRGRHFNSTSADRTKQQDRLYNKSKTDRKSYDYIQPGTEKVFNLTVDSEGIKYLNGVALPDDQQGLWVRAPTSTRDESGVGYGFDPQTAIPLKGLDRLRTVDSLLGRGAGLSSEDKSLLNEPWSRAKKLLISGFTPSAWDAFVKDETSGLTAEGKGLLEMLGELTAEERHALFGSAFTRTEKETSEQFADRVEGLSLDTMLRRLAQGFDRTKQSLTTRDIAGKGSEWADAINRAGLTGYDDYTESLSEASATAEVAPPQIPTGSPVGIDEPVSPPRSRRGRRMMRKENAKIDLTQVPEGENPSEWAALSDEDKLFVLGGFK